jgi:hypothetical protein
MCVCVCARARADAPNPFNRTDINPLGPIAKTHQISRGDVFVSVDPGEELLKVSHEREKNRRHFTLFLRTGYSTVERAPSGRGNGIKL